ncbi:MAG: Putative DNA-binding protein, partial [uncultured Blastococcus sp.]
ARRSRRPRRFPARAAGPAQPRPGRYPAVSRPPPRPWAAAGGAGGARRAEPGLLQPAGTGTAGQHLGRRPRRPVPGAAARRRRAGPSARPGRPDRTAPLRRQRSGAACRPRPAAADGGAGPPAGRAAGQPRRRPGPQRPADRRPGPPAPARRLVPALPVPGPRRAGAHRQLVGLRLRLRRRPAPGGRPPPRGPAAPRAHRRAPRHRPRRGALVGRPRRPRLRLRSQTHPAPHRRSAVLRRRDRGRSVRAGPAPRRLHHPTGLPHGERPAAAGQLERERHHAPARPPV